jgi:hypothetical protein
MLSKSSSSVFDFLDKVPVLFVPLESLLFPVILFAAKGPPPSYCLLILAKALLSMVRPDFIPVADFAKIS